MKSYIVSIVITSIIIALTELILPHGKLKSVVRTVFSLTLLVTMISPLSKDEFIQGVPSFKQEVEQNITNPYYVNEYFEDRLEIYYQTLFKNQLLKSDLVTEDIIVEIDNMQICKVKIFLSNLVIPENNLHIDNNVIAKYVANVLQIDVSKVEIYA